MAEHTEETSSPYKIDWLRTLAGALAAVTAAVVLSRLGAAGTLIGAALGSVAATAGSALYAQGLARSKKTVLKAQESALLKVGVPPQQVRRAHRIVAEDDADVEQVEQPGTVEDAAEPTRFAALPWKRIGLIAAATFVAVMVLISAFELASGRSVSSYTGGSGSHQGSTFGGVTGHSGGSGSHKPSHKPTTKPSTSQKPSSSPAPSHSSTPSTTPSPTPSSTPTPTPTPTPTESSTPSSTPSATPTGAGSPTPSP